MNDDQSSKTFKILIDYMYNKIQERMRETGEDFETAMNNYMEENKVKVKKCPYCVDGKMYEINYQSWYKPEDAPKTIEEVICERYCSYCMGKNEVENDQRTI